MFRKRFERGNIVRMKQDTGLEVISETRRSDLVPVSYFSERLGTRKRCMGKWWNHRENMFDFSIFFYFISIGIVCLHPFCKGATHWFVTEDGRIQQQVTNLNFYLLNYSHQLRRSVVWISFEFGVKFNSFIVCPFLSWCSSSIDWLTCYWKFLDIRYSWRVKLIKSSIVFSAWHEWDVTLVNRLIRFERISTWNILIEEPKWIIDVVELSLK